MKRQKPQPAHSKTGGFPFKLVLFLLFLVILLSAGTITLAKSISQSSYFTIKDIFANEPDQTQLKYLIGRNIFSVDLKQEADDLTAEYPAYRAIRIIRVLPDRIYIEFIRRKPIALLRMYKYMFVDSTGVLFDIPRDQTITDLPAITGLETRIFGPKSGRKYNSKELLAAIEIILEGQKFRWFNTYRIERIDVASLESISIFMRLPKDQQAVQLLEIKMDSREIRNKFRVLVQLLKEVKGDSGKIKYVDLRFKEPVIKFKDVR
jgi:cell division septal protein FtsQ